MFILLADNEARQSSSIISLTVSAFQDIVTSRGHLTLLGVNLDLGIRKGVI